MNYDNLKKFVIEISDIIGKEQKFLTGFILLFAGISGIRFYFNSHLKPIDFQVIEAEKSEYYYKKSESINPEYSKNQDVESHNQKLFSFNPNSVSKEELLQLGFSEKVANIFLKYRNHGGKFFKKEDVRKIFGISERLYQSIEPYIVINTNENPFPSNDSYKNKVEKTPQIIDINKATIEQWESLPYIGKYYAKKLYDFRVGLGGFISIEQLSECYGIQDSTLQKIKPFLKISPVPLRKININEAAESELLSHPFIAKWQAEDILKNRPIYGKDDLFELRTFKDKAKNQRLIPYLSF